MSAVNDVFDRERLDFLHLGYYVLSYVAVMTMWWAQWMMVNVESWTFPGFVLVMASPITQYFAVHSLLSPNPSEVNNWRAHLKNGHRWYFSTMLVSVIAVGTRRVYLAEESFLETPLFIVLCGLVFVWAIVSPARIAHIVALVTWALSLGFAVAAQYSI